MHFCFRRGRGVSGGACDPTLQANEGEAAEADHSLRRGSRPKGANGPPKRAGLVGPLLTLLKTCAPVADSRGPWCRLRVRWRRGSHARLPGLGRERGQLLPDEGTARGGARLRERRAQARRRCRARLPGPDRRRNRCFPGCLDAEPRAVRGGGSGAGSRSPRSRGTSTRPGTESPSPITCRMCAVSPTWTPRGPT